MIQQSTVTLLIHHCVIIVTCQCAACFQTSSSSTLTIDYTCGVPSLCVQLAFGNARIPEDYHNKDQSGWVGAARWLTRNAKLFAKGKLGDKRYELIRNILGQSSPVSPLAGHRSMYRHNPCFLSGLMFVAICRHQICEKDGRCAFIQGW